MDFPLRTDHGFFKEIASGDEQAFRRIFHAYNAKLYPFVLKKSPIRRPSPRTHSWASLRLRLRHSKVTPMDHPAFLLYKVASNLSLTHPRNRALELRRLQKMESDHPLLTNDLLGLVCYNICIKAEILDIRSGMTEQSSSGS
jgi:RNA polymerase sigma-70 factor (ECF subfamily)